MQILFTIFSSERVLIEHKKTCLEINGKQTVKLRIGSIKFKNYCKQLAVPFKIYAYFESLPKGVNSNDRNNDTSYTEKYQAHIPCSFTYKVVRVGDKFSKPVVLYRGRNAVNRFIETVLKEYAYCKSVMKKHFNKNLVMSEKDEQRFQSSNKCWICDKLFEVGDNKVRNYCHITRKYRGSAHWSCNINLKLSKKLPVIFYNLRGYDSHLIIREIGKFDVKVNVIPNGLEKYMAFTINNNLVFIGSMQFMNSSVDALVRNLSDNDFKYLPQEFSGDLSELVKEKGVYPYEYMDSFEKFFDEKLPDRHKFFSSLKAKCISEKDYSHAINVWNTFKMNTMGDYHDLHLKTDILLLADVFEKFVDTCLEYYGLDPCHCLGKNNNTF